jgi:hypothetical protein
MNSLLIQTEDSFDYDDASLMGTSRAAWSIRYLFSALHLLGFELGVFAVVMLLEYLKSHIGEKRSAIPVNNINNVSLLTRSFVTVLFYRTVFLFIFPAPYWDDMDRLSKSFVRYFLSGL